MTVDIDANLGAFLARRAPEARYASFDYCFNYFQAARGSGETARLAGKDRLLVSCLQLGFFLASWGMMRRGSGLMQRSVRDLVPVVELIAAEPSSTWDLDVDSYADQADEVLAVGRRVRKAFTVPASDILVTKTMLGVFGSPPSTATSDGASAATPSARMPCSGSARSTRTTRPRSTVSGSSSWISSPDWIPRGPTLRRRSST